MARSGLMATTSSFAHLLGLGAPAAGKSRAEEKDEPDDKEKGEAEGEDEKDDDKKKDGKKAKSKKAKAEDEEEDEDEPQDEADDDKDNEDPKSKAARTRERARCAAIFASPAAGLRPDMAAHLAFQTNMSRADALDALEVATRGQAKAAPSPKGRLADRMDRTPNPEIGPDAEASALKPHQRLMAAHAKATGQKP